MSDTWTIGTGVGRPANGPLGSIAEAARSREVAGHREIVLQSGLPLEFLDGQPTAAPDSVGRRKTLRLKRLMDVVVSILAIVFLAPLLLIVALLVKVTSRGPVLFRQQRVGRDGALFELVKFRSLRVEHCDATGVSQVLNGDIRFTPIGELLRKTSIDELPQLFNVLFGQMSLVGPRPHVPGQMAGGVPYAELVPYYSLRWQVLPGLTGWAQSNRLRGSTADAVTAKARVDHDIAYIQGLSLLLDARVLVLTLRHELFGR